METPHLEHQFGVRIATAYRPTPDRGPSHWVAVQVWDLPEHWVVTQIDGSRPYDWEYAQECLGEEEEAGRFASFAREFIAKRDLDRDGLRTRFDAEFSGDGRIAWWTPRD